MTIAIGTQLGSHEITALIGRGGMGEVYRARDTRLKRDVASKILPEQFARDPERVSRFCAPRKTRSVHPKKDKRFKGERISGSKGMPQIAVPF